LIISSVEDALSNKRQVNKQGFGKRRRANLAGWIHPSQLRYQFLELKIKYFRIGHHINQMGGAIEQHVAEKLCLVNLTGICTWQSNPDGDLVFN
jgi:hypothetical protein